MLGFLVFMAVAGIVGYIAYTKVPTFREFCLQAWGKVVTVREIIQRWLVSKGWG